MPAAEDNAGGIPTDYATVEWQGGKFEFAGYGFLEQLKVMRPKHCLINRMSNC